MIGFVSPQLRALLRVSVLGERILEIEAAIDTGFSAFLSLPSQTIEHLGLQPRDVLIAVLADGSEVEVQTFRAQVMWNNETRNIYVLQAESHPLIGMALLENCSLQIDVRDGGRVLVETI